MKSNKGITLISLMIYMIVLLLVMGILSVISSNFFSNTKYIKEKGRYMAGYNKFNMYFIEDVKNNTDIFSCTKDEIIFGDGTIYTFKDNIIYRNKIKISNNIFGCNFSQTSENVKGTTKKIISVRIVIEGENVFDKTTDYVLKYY